MKKIYLFLLALCSYLPLSATHIIGGSISYEYLGGDEYKIRLEVLRDCHTGIPWFDDPASIGIFDSTGDLLYELLVPMDPYINDTISLAVPNSVCIFPPDVCVHRTIYETTANLPTICYAA